MLGNFSFGDYFKREAVAFAWDLSREGFGLPADDIWITVFGGDDELGIGPDNDAIDAWIAVGVPRERIVECPRSENFWQVGPVGPCGPCSELYLDRGLEFGKPEDLPGGDNERFLEYWNLVFMQFDQNPENVLTPLPAKNIDTGLGLNRMAAIKQGKETVFETDQFAPLIELGEQLSGRRYGEEYGTDRALRVLADHSRAVTFLIADGVVPSTEDRGYVLRRVMRRAILQGRQTLQLEPGFLRRYQDVVTELMGLAVPAAARAAGATSSAGKWLRFRGGGLWTDTRAGLQAARPADRPGPGGRGAEGISAADAFALHDTHGFPFDLTLELVAEHGLGVDEQGFEALMEDQRRRARASGGRGLGGAEVRERAVALSGEAGFQTEFHGYQTTALETTVGALARDGDRFLVKLLESPFYPTGGGQIAEQRLRSSRSEDGDCLVRVDDVLRLGADQVLAVVPEHGSLREGERVRARVDRDARHATECNHTATHLLHAALRSRLGSHVRQAGSYVGPDKLRFDFTHGSAMTAEELRDVEDTVNRWILAAQPVRALTTTLHGGALAQGDGAVRRRSTARSSEWSRSGMDRSRARFAAVRTYARPPRSRSSRSRARPRAPPTCGGSRR